MSKLKKIKWLMFILGHDGLPQRTLTDDMDPIELYCALVLLARVYTYVGHRRLPFELSMALSISKNRYARSNRGVEKRRLKKLRDAYDEFLFKWESDPLVSDMY